MTSKTTIKPVLARLAGGFGTAFRTACGALSGALFGLTLGATGAFAFPGAAEPAAPGLVTEAQYGYGEGYDRGRRPRGYSHPPTRGPGYRDYDYKSYNYRAGRGAGWNEYRRNTSRKERVRDYYRLQQREAVRQRRGW